MTDAETGHRSRSLAVEEGTMIQLAQPHVCAEEPASVHGPDHLQNPFRLPPATTWNLLAAPSFRDRLGDLICIDVSQQTCAASIAWMPDRLILPFSSPQAVASVTGHCRPTYLLLELGRHYDRDRWTGNPSTITIYNETSMNLRDAAVPRTPIDITVWLRRTLLATLRHPRTFLAGAKITAIRCRLSGVGGAMLSWLGLSWLGLLPWPYAWYVWSGKVSYIHFSTPFHHLFVLLLLFSRQTSAAISTMFHVDETRKGRRL
ncbi:hypothetical protein CONLIGDRAFT_674628 [Coniochaeta ligniaria NRRL 30616]|uniref:Uncharacterized protein n=1 Tax=Coniochaeta ligniaria NRRL 30616 TaxID=1408157 RepID=A0A1J7J6S4_9PEZI|nr:hypothetical protein CONLIGDRAFT_674628 [Coniochaeta ligniaria NRRL 30616]